MLTYSDPRATFAVSSIGPETFGIHGYYADELSAHRAAKELRAQGNTNVSVDPYSPYVLHPGIHSKIPIGDGEDDED